MAVVAYCPNCKAFKLTSDVESANTCETCHQRYVFTDITQNKWVMMTANEKRDMLRLWFGEDDDNPAPAASSEKGSSSGKTSSKLMPSFWMTGGSSFEGFSIFRYLGIFSGQSIMLKASYPDLASVSSDTSGGLSKRLSTAIDKARTQALCNLQNSCIEAGANAAICVSVKTGMLGDVVMVTADATAVCIERQKD